MKVPRLDASAPLAAAGAVAKDTDPGTAFEQLFVRTVLHEVERAMPGGSLLGGDAGMFSDVLVDELAARIAESGKLGLADHLDRGVDVSRPAARAYGFHAPSGTADLPVDGRVTSTFGVRPDPLTGELRHHDGIDVAAPEGTPIEAVRGGVVTFAGERGGYGNAVVVDHGDGTETLYGHCRDLSVQVGQRVHDGDVLGTVGSTGRSTGPHVHYEVRRDGKAVDPR